MTTASRCAAKLGVLESSALSSVSRHPDREAEVEGVQRLDRREAGKLGEHLPRALGAVVGLGAQHAFQEVGEARFVTHGRLRGGRILAEHPLELELLAELPDALVLQVHGATSASNAP